VTVVEQLKGGGITAGGSGYQFRVSLGHG
jgi:hypothetical protein